MSGRIIENYWVITKISLGDIDGGKGGGYEAAAPPDFKSVP